MATATVESVRGSTGTRNRGGGDQELLLAPSTVDDDARTGLQSVERRGGSFQQRLGSLLAAVVGDDLDRL